MEPTRKYPGGYFRYDEAGDLKTRTLPRHPDQYGPTMTITYDRNDVGDPEQIIDGRGHTLTNGFLDTGQLRTTDRPSWWFYDEQQGVVRERTEQDGKPAGGGRDLPSEQGHGDFGKTEPQAMPDLLPRAGDTTLDYDQDLRLASVTDAEANVQQIGYDATGRMTSRTMPLQGRRPRPQPRHLHARRRKSGTGHRCDPGDLGL